MVLCYFLGEGTSMHPEEPSVNCTIHNIEDMTASQGENGDKMIEESTSAGILSHFLT